MQKYHNFTPRRVRALPLTCLRRVCVLIYRRQHGNHRTSFPSPSPAYHALNTTATGSIYYVAHRAEVVAYEQTIRLESEVYSYLAIRPTHSQMQNKRKLLVIELKVLLMQGEEGPVVLTSHNAEDSVHNVQSTHAHGGKPRPCCLDAAYVFVVTHLF